MFTQKDKYLVEGVFLRGNGRSVEVCADVVVAKSKAEAMETAFNMRVKEDESYYVQGAVPLLQMIRTLRKIYDEPVETTRKNFLNRNQS